MILYHKLITILHFFDLFVRHYMGIFEIRNIRVGPESEDTREMRNIPFKNEFWILVYTLITQKKTAQGINSMYFFKI